MAALSDPFINCVLEARRRLERREGRHISVRELARRAGIPQNTLAYNLRPKPAGSHRQINPDLVVKLARVLPIDEADLMRSAHISSGYALEGCGKHFPEIKGAIVHYLDQEPDPERRMAAVADLLAIIADQHRKIAEATPKATTPKKPNRRSTSR